MDSYCSSHTSLFEVETLCRNSCCFHFHTSLYFTHTLHASLFSKFECVRTPDSDDDLSYLMTLDDVVRFEGYLFTSLLPPANEVWGKVIFSEACLKNSVHKGVSASMHAGISHPLDHPPGTSHPPPPRSRACWEIRWNVRAVRILLECIFVVPMCRTAEFTSVWSVTQIYTYDTCPLNVRSCIGEKAKATWLPDELIENLMFTLSSNKKNDFVFTFTHFAQLTLLQKFSFQFTTQNP